MLVLALLFLGPGFVRGELSQCLHPSNSHRPESVCARGRVARRCLTAIRARDNLPVLSWLILRGKCRHCRVSISPRYLIVELTVGLLFAGIYLAAVALAPGDVWDDAGPFRVLLLLLVSWALIGLIVVAALMSYDKRDEIHGA